MISSLGNIRKKQDFEISLGYVESLSRKEEGERRLGQRVMNMIKVHDPSVLTCQNESTICTVTIC